jgi:hypothetical protein
LETVVQLTEYGDTPPDKFRDMDPSAAPTTTQFEVDEVTVRGLPMKDV